MANNAQRFDVDKGRIEHDGTVIVKIANRPLIPSDLWDDSRLDFKEGHQPVADDLSDLPDDLQSKLERHGYF